MAMPHAQARSAAVWPGLNPVSWNPGNHSIIIIIILLSSCLILNVPARPPINVLNWCEPRQGRCGVVCVWVQCVCSIGGRRDKMQTKIGRREGVKEPESLGLSNWGKTVCVSQIFSSPQRLYRQCGRKVVNYLHVCVCEGLIPSSLCLKQESCDFI